MKKLDRKLYSVKDVAKFILEGRIMLLSGDNNLFTCLPKGNWIGGTTPYFMNNDFAAVCTEDKIFVDDFSDSVQDFRIIKYDKKNIKNIAVDAFDNGFTLLVIAFETETFYEFGVKSLSYLNIFNNPIAGYVSGCKYEDLGVKSGKVYNGQNIKDKSIEAIALHVELPETKNARVEMFNFETVNTNSPEIKFPKTSFVQSDCTIDGIDCNIADFFIERNYINYPILADYNGALINRVIRNIDTVKKEVSFFAPCFYGESYYLANIVSNYQDYFFKNIEAIGRRSRFISACLSYYFLGDLENKKTYSKGVFAYGEIAYQLISKTLISLEISEL